MHLPFPPAASPLDQVVCEVPWGTRLPPGFRWYELALDAPDAPADLDITRVPDGAQGIAATHATEPGVVCRRIEHALRSGFKYVLFESVDAGLVPLVHQAQAHAIATRHLTSPPTGPDDLLTVLAGLAETGAGLIKVAYRADTPTDIAAGLIALDLAAQTFPQPASVTPMGPAWGRVAAAVAGSRLVFAPLIATPDRPSAAQMLAWMNDLTRAGSS